MTLVFASPSLASEVAPPEPARAIRATAADLLALSDQRIHRGRVRQAEKLLTLLTSNPDAEVRSEARFRLAQLMEARGHFRDAAVVLRQILDDRPDTPTVRVKLATLLQRMGDEDSALRELRALRSADLPPNVARFVDRLSASLQATKPFGFQVEFALAPDSNINRATRSDTLGTVFGDFIVDEDSKARSGVGAAVRAMAQARRPITSTLNLIARVSGDANLYRHDEFDDIGLELSAGGELKLGKTRVSAEAGFGHIWYGMKPYQRNIRLSGTVSRPVGPTSQLRFDASARWVENKLNDLQDGTGFTGRLRYERALSPRLFLSASVGADRFKARDDAYSTKSWSAGITGYREMGRMTMFAGAEIGHLKADERLALLPEAREDRLRRIQLGVVYRQFTFGGFAPMTRLVVERNQSSVKIHDYQRTRTEFGISRAF